ncbi:MAG TPA: hypothetical protein PLU87_18980 [Sedimentisphaerales bacterium]|nr:hypothetical protein [Sedimentisphaerales bacterium]HRS13213.1 hypothetical protein [Sedimentisphaerales bacterium]
MAITMTLTEKRAKINNILAEMEALDRVERDYRQAKWASRLMAMNVPLDSDDPTRQAIEAILEMHIKSLREQLHKAFELACAIKPKGGDA